MSCTLQEAAQAAKSCESSSGLPAALTLAQWIIESGRGKHCPGNNCFGIKASHEPEPSKKQLLQTHEWFTESEAQDFVRRGEGRTVELVIKDGAPLRKGSRLLYKAQDWFARYDSLEAGFDAHGRLLTSGRQYAKAWQAFRGNGNTERFVRAMAPIYATSPDYTDHLLALMNSEEIKSALATDLVGA